MMWGDHWMRWNGENGWSSTGFGGDWLMFFGMILIPILVVLLVVLAMRVWTPQAGVLNGAANGATQSPASPPPQFESPRDILKRRYAAGEIERDEYFQRMADLTQ